MSLLELQKLATQSYYEDGIDYSESDSYRGDSRESWVQELGFRQKTPVLYTATAESAVTTDDTTASVSLAAGQSGRIYKGDVLWFSLAQVLLVVSTDTDLTDVATNVPIFPASGDVAIGDTASTYLCRPIFSFEDGFIVNSSGTDASSRNRGQSLYSTKMVVGRDYSMSAAGRTVRQDPGLGILESVKNTNRRFYFEARWRPFDNYGIGLSAEVGRAFVNSSSPTAPASDFHKVSYDIMGDGKPLPYLPLGMTVAEAKLLLPNDSYVQYLK